MFKNRNINRIMGALLVIDLGLLAISGIPAFKQADDGWKWAVGGAAWLSFVVLSVALIGLAGVTLWRRRRSRGVVVDRGRRTALWGAAALAAAMLADLAEFVLDPASSGKASQIVQASVVHHDKMVICGYLLLASSIFLFPGVFFLTRGLRERGRRLGQVAMVLGFLGALGHAALATAYLSWAAMPGEGTDQAPMVAMRRRARPRSHRSRSAFSPSRSRSSLRRAPHPRPHRPAGLLAPVVAAPVSASPSTARQAPASRSCCCSSRRPWSPRGSHAARRPTPALTAAGRRLPRRSCRHRRSSNRRDRGPGAKDAPGPLARSDADRGARRARRCIRDVGRERMNRRGRGEAIPLAARLGQLQTA